MLLLTHTFVLFGLSDICDILISINKWVKARFGSSTWKCTCMNKWSIKWEIDSVNVPLITLKRIANLRQTTFLCVCGGGGGGGGGEKIRLYISSESPALQTIHINIKSYLIRKNRKETHTHTQTHTHTNTHTHIHRMSSAAVATNTVSISVDGSFVSTKIF